MSTDGDGRTATSQSLERGLAILSSFSSERRLIGVSELSTRARPHAEHDAPVRRHPRPARVPPPGRGLAEVLPRPARPRPRLHRDQLDGASARRRAVPPRLCDETGHTVNMAILDDVDIVYVERVRASRRRQNEIDLDLHVGSRLPAYCTSLGKVLLAYLTDADRDDGSSAGSRSRVGDRTRSPRRRRCSPSFGASVPRASP